MSIENARERSKRPAVIAAGVLLGLVLVAYAATLGYEFVWDDAPLIVNNRLVQDPGEIGTVLTSGFWETGDRHDRFRSFFRPLVALTYSLDFAIWGLEPFGFHLTNVLLHLACCWLVFRIARHEGLGDGASLAGAALFAVHPVHVESVAWISGRTDLVCAVLMLGAFLLYRRGNAPGGGEVTRVASWLLFGLALFSKEMAATLPILVFVDRALERGPRRFRSALGAAAPFLVVLGLYVGARTVVLGSGAAGLFELEPLGFAATAAFVVARYLTLLLVPVGLDAHYPYAPFGNPWNLQVLIAGGMVALLLGVFVVLARRRSRAAAWLGWTVLSLGPVMAFGRFGDVVIADRFLYIPSVGLALLLALGVHWLLADARLQARSTTVVAGLLVGCALLGLAARERAKIWRDDHALFSDMVETSPGSALVRCNLGSALYARGDVDAALEEFRLAMRLAPGYSLAHNNLAAALDRKGRAGEALQHYRIALQHGPGLVEARANVGNLLVRLGKVEAGLAQLRELAEDHPRAPAALYALAEALDHSGRPEEALPHLERIRVLDDRHAESHYLLGKIRHEQGRAAEAAASMQRFLELWDQDGVHASAARRVIAEHRAEASSPAGSP
jgi:Flp pilus assembly protein TadD